MNMLEKAKAKLQKYNQLKMLNILEKLYGENKEKLAEDILETDIEQIMDLYKNKNNKKLVKDIIEPIEYIDKNLLSKKELETFSNLGKEIIENGEYAVITLAGGQGTRLGFDGPKGTFKLDIGNGKYIFEIFVDNLKKAKKQYGREIYWYIMTSKENHKDTVDFFEKHNYFGYDKNKIKFFSQTFLPVIDMEGNLLVNNNYEIKKASDGNGAIYKSLKIQGILEDMKQKNIKWVYIANVDNIMAKIVDDVFLGLAIKNNLQSAWKAVAKDFPEEKVGVFCKRNGKFSVIEYIDMSENMIYAKKENGEPLYNESNIGNYLIRFDALEKLTTCNLQYHCANKKNSYIDENLNEIIPTEPNTYKFETFIFDGFDYLEDIMVMRVLRDEEFAPIKNATGVDSPETAIQKYNKYNKA